MVNKAITSSEFSSILSKYFLFEDKPHIAISVSGGADSLALLILMKNWIIKNDGKLTIIHFNHSLRKESLKEAKYVERISENFNLACKVLKWKKINFNSSLMQSARTARYSKIIDFCEKEQIISLMTAHHFDDCLETYLMRKERKFTTLGLNSIPRINIQKNLQILRPFIGIKKKRLIQTCINQNIKWINDPSNENERFERVRLRKSISKLKIGRLKSLEKELTDNLKKNIKMEKNLSNFFVKNLIFFDYGKFSICKNILLDESKSFQIEIIKKILVTCSGKIYPPRYMTVDLLLEKIKNHKKFKFTIHSCVVDVAYNVINFYREYKRIIEFIPDKILLKKNESILWDNRFIIKSNSMDLYCLSMKEKIWLKLKSKFNVEKKEKKIKFDILKTLPVLKIKENFIIPYLSPNQVMTQNSISVTFSPVIPLTKKNF